MNAKQVTWEYLEPILAQLKKEGEEAVYLTTLQQMIPSTMGEKMISSFGLRKIFEKEGLTVLRCGSPEKLAVLLYPKSHYQNCPQYPWKHVAKALATLEKDGITWVYLDDLIKMLPDEVLEKTLLSILPLNNYPIKKMGSNYKNAVFI